MLHRSIAESVNDVTLSQNCITVTCLNASTFVSSLFLVLTKRNRSVYAFTLYKINKAPMKKLLYPLAIIMVITLAFGYFGLQANNLVQVLLVIAIVSVLSAFIFPGKSKKVN